MIGQRLRRVILANWPAKVLSLVAALGIWFSVVSAQQRVGNFPGGIPVDIQHVPDGLVAIADTEEISLSVIADQAAWSQFTADTFHASVDVNSASAGVVDAPVTVTSSIPGVQITKVSPSTVLVRLEKLATKKVPVQIRLDGQPADGFAPGEVTTNPTTVTVSGPESRLKQVDQVIGTVSLNGERSDFDQTAPVKAIVAGEELANISIDPTTVVTHVPIERAGNVKAVGVVVKTDGSVPSGYVIANIQSQPSVVSVTGTSVALAALDAVETQPISLSDVTAKTAVQVSLALPSGIRLVDTATDTVQVTLQVQEVTIRRDFDLPVLVTDIPANQSVISRSPDTAHVTLEGPLSQLGSLVDSAVRLEIPLPKGLPPGTHDLDVFPEHIIRPSDISVTSVDPQKVTIELQASGQ